MVGPGTVPLYAQAVVGLPGTISTLAGAAVRSSSTTPGLSERFFRTGGEVNVSSAVAAEGPVWIAGAPPFRPGTAGRTKSASRKAKTTRMASAIVLESRSIAYSLNRGREPTPRRHRRSGDLDRLALVRRPRHQCG